jgi:hypothetical protein
MVLLRFWPKDQLAGSLLAYKWQMLLKHRHQLLHQPPLTPPPSQKLHQSQSTPPPSQQRQSTPPPSQSTSNPCMELPWIFPRPMHDVAPVKLRLLLQTTILVIRAEDGTLRDVTYYDVDDYKLIFPTVLLILYDSLIFPILQSFGM